MTAEDFLQECQSRPGIVVLFKRARCCPLFLCQSCGERIRTIGSAGVVYGMLDMAEEGHQRVPVILCKKPESCLNDPSLGHPLWDELRDFLVNLARNSGTMSQAAWGRLWKAVIEFDKLMP